MRQGIFKKGLCTVLACTLVLLAASCQRKQAAKSTAKETVIAMVTNQSGLGDQSFNDTTWAGLQKAETELGIVKKISEAKEQAQYVPNLTAFAQQKCDLVIGVGFMIKDAVKEAAAQYPATHFAIVDGEVEAPNVACLLFKENEGAYLVGVIAGMMTKSRVVGFVGGMSSPPVMKFEVGYRAGVMSVDPKIKVLIAYAGSFSDPGKGEETAVPQYRQGADIVFHASGGTGLGVINAAKKLGKFAIGVDIDQNYLAPENVMTSVIKRVDIAAFNAIKMVKEGTFKGGTYRYGIKEGGMDYAPSTSKHVPQRVIDEVERIKRLIGEGKIVPPATYEELTAFKPPA